ncbi:hypothetical protein C8R47DRAFT_1255078 [Mycena vitilis]|nr:hypothetical protein C8R47DRAFT_1255078 [Mycena vitilis]
MTSERDTVFKVHRHYLSPDNEETVFTGLFALPVPHGISAEGRRDEKAYTIAGRYCVPRRIPDTDLLRLVETARFSHKYELASFEHWAKETIISVISRNDSRALRTCKPEIYISLPEFNSLSPLPVLRDLPGLRDRVTDAWLARLRLPDGKRDVNVAQMLDVGYKFQLRPFLGQVYYEQLKRFNLPPGRVAVIPGLPTPNAERTAFAISFVGSRADYATLWINDMVRPIRRL